MSFSFLVAFIYCALQGSLSLSWRRLDSNLFWEGEFPLVSIVIAARNEAHNLHAVIGSILGQKYPGNLFELILVDNHSTDESLSIMISYARSDARITVIDLSKMLPADQAFKKHALSAGIEKARGEIILTTDADCKVPEEWMHRMIGYILATGKDLITGPVEIAEANLFIEKYQQLELAGLAVATGGGIQNRCLLMANGANLAFKRQHFQNQMGYSGMPAIASGDDVFLLQKLYSIKPSSVGFIKDSRAIVTTQACPDLRSFLQQRKRWSSKTRLYQHLPTQISALVVALNSAMILLHLILSLIWGFPFYVIFVAHFLIKVIADTFLLRTGCVFFRLRFKPLFFLVAHLINPFITSLVAAMNLSSRSYRWKGRKTS